MINVTLPDGSVRELPEGASPLDLAEDISKSLAKAAIIAQVNGQDWDLKRPLDGDANVAIITRKDDKALEVIRHDTAHILAQAVQDLFPGTQVTIGPAIEDGFYYDFARDEPFSPEDFEAIEKRMGEIVDADLPFEREVWDREDAIAKFEAMGEAYKAELIRDLPEDETITIYRQGDWFDLCLGPHLPSTGKIGKAFKLMKVAGAYWRGDHRNAMLQRIYGTAWADDKQLKAHLHRLEEAEKRDHRKLGRQMELFHFQEEAQGQVFWHPNGWRLYRTVMNYMRRRLETAGYVEIKTPQLMDRKFWEASGHWDKYRENMFISSIDQEEKVLAVKPMNCPCHVQVFNQGQKSYRDLPLRMAEFGSCHRYEPSGSLHGLMRVRGFVQDDAHIFCTGDQITAEVSDFCELLKSVYADFGFDEPRIKFSDRPEQRVGSDEVWDKAEASLKAAAEASGLDYEYNPGDGAFYGPKLDFVVKDAIGREWQTGTIQCDFNLPERLDASFIGDDSEKHRPVMLHRAILGSLERFLGVLIESYAGKLPFWLAPRQVVIATITSDADAYAEEVKAAMLKAGLHAETDLRNEKINYKVREHSVGKVPVIAVVGRKEAEEGTLALRFLGEGGKTQEILPLAEAIARLGEDAKAPDLKRA
ncbi:threonine--tRNA ligase [Maricaulis maris]|uniref:threonine--tRNA ligase n=1 Tax=Maricaulis maris TaxID=74318 RepID=UPI00292586CE|nr:threonine--tRNA ligase [Maricaulis maris]